MSAQPEFTFGPALPTLPAARVRLRALAEPDVPALFGIFGDPLVTQYWGHPVLPDMSAAATLLGDIRNYFARRTLLQWGLACQATGTVIGTCTLAALDPINRRAELGFALGRAYWGNGYMLEALPVLLGFAFAEMKLHRITADVDPRNVASIRILERLGFRREGIMREHYLMQGEPQDAMFYGLLSSEWRG